jgi:cytochrome c-type biogenesis protein CcmH
MIIIFYILLGVMVLLALASIVIPLIKKQAWKSTLAIIILLPAFAVFLYIYQGSGKQWLAYQHTQQQLAQVQQFRSQLGTPQQVIDKLKQRLQQDPNSAQGWYLLGRIYFDQQRFTEAVDTFSKAYALQPKQPEVLFYYAESLSLTQHTLSGKPTTLLQQLLKLQPDNDAAMNLLAVAAFNEKRYQEAINYWEKMLPHYAPDSEDGKALLTAIAKAQTALNKQQKGNN